MNYFLFRKLEIENKSYYQFYKVAKDFKPNDDFTTFDNRKEKDFFYVREDNISISDQYLYYIFEDKNGTFTNITDVHTLNEIYDKFKEKYEDLKDTELSVIELKPIDEMVEIVDNVVKYQKESVKTLVNQIYRNQQILESNLPNESKRIQKNNILFYGPRSNSKKKIANALEKNLGLPYADVEIPITVKEDGFSFPTAEETKLEIARQLLENRKDNIDVNNGIVFIREDYDEKDKMLKKFATNKEMGNMPIRSDYILGGVAEKFRESFIGYIGSLTDSKPFKYRGYNFDFKKITFVISYDRKYSDDEDSYDLVDVLNEANCDYVVPIKELTKEEKLKLLIADDGVLSKYKNYLNSCGKNLIVSGNAIVALIDKCNEIDPGMDFLNMMIEYIIKFTTSREIVDVQIDEEKVQKFCERYLDNKEEIDGEVELLPEIKPVFEKLKEKIVGQDKGLKTILYNIIENRRMANREELEDPKQYIKNILVRGESGGGKTFIITNIAKLLNIPCYIADATQYTEAGYAGADVTDMLAELYHRADDDLESAEKGILVIDEVDKKATDIGRNNDVSRGAVLNSLLKIVEGSEITVNVGSKMEPDEIVFDTSRLTVICSGAFENIEKIRDNRVKKLLGNSAIGFDNKKEVALTIDRDIIDKDYVDFGMMRQFMARIPVIVNLSKNTKETLKNIMINSNASALKIEAIRLLTRGIILEYADDFYDKLAEEAMKLDIGVRGIDKVLQKVLTDINIYDVDENEIQKIILNGEVISDASKVIMIPRKKHKVLKKVGK